MLTALHRPPLDIQTLSQAPYFLYLRRFSFAHVYSSTFRKWYPCSHWRLVPDVDSQSSGLPKEEDITKPREQGSHWRDRIVESFWDPEHHPNPWLLTVGGKSSLSSIRPKRHWCSCVREISSNAGRFLPRKAERYSGRELDRNPYSERQAKFDENFKRVSVVKKPLSEYRQATVEKSTKNIPLVPKKWKRAIPSKEAVDAVMYLLRAKGNKDAVKEVMRKRIGRLLRLELMLVLSELQRIDECYLARQVFNAVRLEPWYKPDVYLYQTMVDMLGKNKQMGEAIKMFDELHEEGLRPDGSIQRTLLKAYVSNDMIPEAIELYKEIQNSELDRAARSILFHGLSAEEKLELADYEKRQGYDWS